MSSLKIFSRIQKIEKLQNGIDLRGHVLAENQPQQNGPVLDKDSAFWIGYGFGKWLKATLPGQKSYNVGIGRDTRQSGQVLLYSVAKGLLESGAQPIDVGICTTPSMFYVCNANIFQRSQSSIYFKETENTVFPIIAGIVLTASHLPPPWNGFKMFTRNTPNTIGPEGIEGILQQLQHVSDLDFDTLCSNNDDKHSKVDLFSPPVYPILPLYSAYLQSLIREQLGTSSDSLPLTGLKICINSGYGSTSFFVNCLAELGADVSASFHLHSAALSMSSSSGSTAATETVAPTTTPSTSTHEEGKGLIANPENVQMMAETLAMSKDHDCDIGLCFDSDGDRVGFVEPLDTTTTTTDNNRETSQRSYFHRNQLIAIVSYIASNQFYQTQGTATTTDTPQTIRRRPLIVTDSATSFGLHRYLTDHLQMQQLRYRKGSRYVMQLAQQLVSSSSDEVMVAMECSGHSAWRENGWIDDACYTAIKVIVAYMQTRQRMLSSSSSDENQQQEEEKRPTSVLRSMIAEMKDPIESVELRVRMISTTPGGMISSAQRDEIAAAATLAFQLLVQQSSNWQAEASNYEGFRANYLDTNTTVIGWCMVRASLHEPILSIHIESDVQGGVQQIKDDVFAYWKHCATNNIFPVLSALQLDS
jgi:phosphomannomutase